MPTETDIRLRSWLDANQRDREQMCRSVLALDPHYSEVKPRHPLGGPDGGRDMEAVFESERAAYGAVGFQNSANDSDDQKRRIRAKFTDDLKSALAAKPNLKVFAFFTNLRFPMGDQSEMKIEARKAGIDHCDIFDRERLRIELDSPAGFFVRFQYLGIPLSEAEQASFLAHYGDRIQEVVSTGFQRIERTLNRILFIQESDNILSGIQVIFRLKQSYPAAEIDHFRAFVTIYLRGITHGILSIWFGSSDRPTRFDAESPEAFGNERAGIAHGIATAAWEKHIKGSVSEESGEEVAPDGDGCVEEQDDLVCVGAGSAIGRDPVPAIIIRYTHDDALIRYRPRLKLRDLDDCMFIPFLNRSLAEKLHSLEVFANGYKLAHIGSDAFRIDLSRYEGKIPGRFTASELADPWVRIRPSDFSSTFRLHFYSTTPRRMFEHEETEGAQPITPR